MRLCWLVLWAVPASAAAPGAITGVIDRPKGVTVLAVDRSGEKGKQFKGKIDPKTGKFIVSGLPLGKAYDVVIDFSQFHNGDRINLMDIADQTSGKGRTGVFLPMQSAFALKVLQFRVVTGPVTDPSRIPAVMRQKPTIPDSEIACERTFVFDNQLGGWTVNGQFFNFLPRFQVKQGTAERWTLVNASRDWEHPIHIHLEEHQFEVKDGATPPDAPVRPRLPRPGSGSPGLELRPPRRSANSVRPRLTCATPRTRWRSRRSRATGNSSPASATRTRRPCRTCTTTSWSNSTCSAMRPSGPGIASSTCA